MPRFILLILCMVHFFGFEALGATLDSATIESHSLSILSQNVLRLQRHAQMICPGFRVSPALPRVHATDRFSSSDLTTMRTRVAEQLDSFRNAKGRGCNPLDPTRMIDSFRASEAMIPPRVVRLAEHLCTFQARQPRIKDCEIWFQRALMSMRPRCAKVNKVGLNDYKDSLPCYAGDEVSAAILLAHDPHLSSSHRFLLALWEALNSRDRFDLFGLFLRAFGRHDNRESRLLYLSWLTFGTSATTSVAGHLEGWSLELVFLGLRSGLDGSEIVRRYLVQKNVKDSFSYFLSEAKRLKKDVQFFNVDSRERLAFGSSQPNRHDFMAAFLTCYLTGEGLAEYLPLALGYAYESLDFVSHVARENWTLRQSLTNWKTDVSRYHRSRAVGSAFCAGRPTSPTR